MGTTGRGCNFLQYTYPVVMIIGITTKLSCHHPPPPSSRGNGGMFYSLFSIDQYSGKKENHFGLFKSKNKN